LKGFVALLGKERYLSDFVSILHSSSNSNDCEELEKDLLKSIGRKCLNEGPLLNIRPGGEIGSQGNSPYNGSVIYDLELNSEIHITNISEFNTKHDCTINAIVSRFSKDIDGVVKNRFCLTKNKDKFSYLYDNVTLYISNGGDITMLHKDIQNYLIDNNINPSYAYKLTSKTHNYISSELTHIRIYHNKKDRDEYLENKNALITFYTKHGEEVVSFNNRYDVAKNLGLPITNVDRLIKDGKGTIGNILFIDKAERDSMFKDYTFLNEQNKQFTCSKYNCITYMKLSDFRYLTRTKNRYKKSNGIILIKE
jgi:hypothetical protein